MVDKKVREVLERAREKTPTADHVSVWADRNNTFCDLYSQRGIQIKSTETWEELVEFIDGDRILWRRF